MGMRSFLICCGILSAYFIALPARAENFALSFDGFDDYVRILDSTSLDLSKGMTVEAWIKPRSADGGRFIVSKWNDFTGQWSFGFKNANHTDKLQVHLSQGGYTDLADLKSKTSITTESWLHVAATYDLSTVTLYFNGIKDSSIPASGEIYDSAADLLIGAVNGGLENFNGLIDEVRLWNYARSPIELQKQLHIELSGNEQGLLGYWKFNEGFGQIVYDASPLGKNGVLGSTLYPEANDPIWVLSDCPVVPVPEPSTLTVGLVLIGFLGLTYYSKQTTYGRAQ